MHFLPFILKRAARNWRMLLIVALGVVLSTGLLSSAPILVNTVIELGLPRKLKAARPVDAHIRIFTFENLQSADYRDVDEPLQALLQSRFSGHLDRIVLSISTHWMHPWPGGTPLENERVNFRYFEDFENNVEYVSGAWPDVPINTAGPNGEPVYAVVIGETTAEWYGLSVGNRLPLSFKPDAATADILLEISGIVRPIDPTDPYWLGSLSPLASQANKRYEQQFSTLVPKEVFFEISREHFPRSNAELAWHVILDLDSIRFSHIPTLINTMAALPADLGGKLTFQSDLQNLLLGYYTQSEGVRTPLYLLTAEIVLLALVYVVMTAALSVRSIEREFAVLRSRGATRRQLFRMQLTEALLMSIVAWVSGPALGAFLVRILGRFGPLAELAGSGPGQTIPQNAWTAALIGAVAGIAGLLAPIGPALKRSIVAEVQSTGRERPPLWQRLYLDVMMLALGLVLLFRLQFYGGLTTGRVDWLLLLSPLTILLGAATLVVRIAPPILTGISRLAASARGLAAPLAFWQTARNPSQFSGLVILLTLANALGILATGLNATLNASEIERSRYAAGSDYRLVSENNLSLNDFNTESGIDQAVGAWRDSATVNLKTYRSFPTLDILAIDPRTFTRVTGYRSDFSEEPMGEILGTLLTRVEVPGIALPGEPGEIGLWIYAEADGNDLMRRPLDGNSDRDRLGYFAKMFTSGGESFLLEMKPDSIAGEDVEAPHEPWLYVHADLPELKQGDYPITLHSMWFRHRTKANGQYVIAGISMISLDDLMVRDRNTGEESIIEGFEDAVNVIRHELRGTQNPLSIFAYTRQNSHSGSSSARLLLSYARILSDIGIVFNIADRDNSLLPGVVSRRFLEATDLVVGDEVEIFIAGQSLTFNITGVVNYFPTMYETGSAGFMITSSNALLTRLSNDTSRSFSFNEVLIQAAEGRNAADLVDASRGEILQLWDADEIRQVIKADPMSLGLRGVTFLGYLLTSLLSIVGFATYFYMSIRQRAHSFGILRAMGMSPRQLYSSLAVEQGLVILTGLALGTFLGAFLNDMVLPGLPVTLGESLHIPPFLPRSDWRSVIQVFLTLLIAFTLTFGAATWALWRSRIHEALRYE